MAQVTRELAVEVAILLRWRQPIRVSLWPFIGSCTTIQKIEVAERGTDGP